MPATPYQMKRYAEVTVQQNGHVYLSCDKHYYSVPYTLIGNKAKIIFTSSLVKIYVRGECVATHTSATYPPEYYYRTCDMMLSLQRNHPCDIFDEACEICTENRLFTGKRLENVIRTVQMSSQVRKSATAPEPTDHTNMRGNLFFQ